MSNLSNLLPLNLRLRDWQNEFLTTFLGKTIDLRNRNFLLVATPGAGKTVAQLSAAYILKRLGLIDWIVICVPSDHLRNQMGKDAKERFDFDLYHATGFCNVRDYDGEVLTYAQVCANPGIWRKRCADFRVFLSSDEVHHLADDLSWGSSYTYSFNEASYRLSTSGTPFRSDNLQIPWVEYEDSGDGTLTSKSDYSYGYGRALRDGVCRHVVFPSYDSFCRWLYGSDEFQADFKATLNKQASAQRRNTTIAADGDWFSTVFKDADLRLNKIRGDGHDNAGGLVVCRDKAHAEEIAKVIQKITSKEPLLITSDIDSASDKIENFARQQGSSADRWIVAIKMVSEGVDIKRLRIAIYATNITTEMYFRQFVGRVIRVIGSFDDETAYVYVYPDSEILAFIQRIKEERDHTVRILDEPKDQPSGNTSGEAGQREPEQIKFLSQCHLVGKRVIIFGIINDMNWVVSSK